MRQPLTEGYNHLVDIVPRLASAVRPVALGTLPTPIVDGAIDGNPLMIKCDQETDSNLGGNKIRKLRFLLRPPLRHGFQRLATFGALGSNHAVATAYAARQVGLQPIAYLARQPATPQVAKALAWHESLGTIIRFWGGTGVERRSQVTALQRAEKLRPWLIPLGGSAKCGSLGFIEAAAELKCQIEAGECGIPDRIYLPMGTMGSAVGLAIGLAAAGLRETSIVAVQVLPVKSGFENRVRRFGERLLEYCQHFDPGFVASDWFSRLKIRLEFAGPGYAVSTPATDEAVALARTDLDLELETTYTGKAMAALLSDMRSTDTIGSPLFWNTYSGIVTPPPHVGRASLDLPPELAGWESLPD